MIDITQTGIVLCQAKQIEIKQPRIVDIICPFHTFEVK